MAQVETVTRRPPEFTATRWMGHGDHGQIAPLPQSRYSEVAALKRGQAHIGNEANAGSVTLDGWEEVVIPGDWIIEDSSGVVAVLDDTAKQQVFKRVTP